MGRTQFLGLEIKEKYVLILTGEVRSNIGGDTALIGCSQS